MFNMIINILLFRKVRAKKIAKRFLETLQSELAEEFLEILLKLMSLMFCIDKKFRRNIENFEGRYVFKDRSEEITVSVIFKKSKMKVIEGQIDNTNVIIIYKNRKALMNFLLFREMDILSTIVNQDVIYEGNLNYLSKFVYMVKHLRLMIMCS